MPASPATQAPKRSHLLAGITIPARTFSLLTRPQQSGPAARPRRAAILLLGELLPWLLVMGMAVLSVVRGAFYGFVDDGPYDDSWGGPTRAGAWLAHFGVGLVSLFVAAVALIGLGALRTRLERPAYGEKAPRWAAAVAIFLLIFSVYLLGAWIAQI